MHGLTKDLTGQSFNHLTVMGLSQTQNKTHLQWDCSCKCGKTISCSREKLLKRAYSCGCILKTRRTTIKNLVNKRFGRLIVLERDNNPLYQIVKWKCKCDCGKIKTIRAETLTKGYTKSCGCYSKEIRSGVNSNLWNPSLSQEEREKNTIRNYNPKLQKWRKEVFERDNYTCQITGQIGGKLVSHHLESWNSNPKLRFNINNGVTLTKDVHWLFHKIYKRGNNTKKQFQQFKRYCKQAFL
jgi:hypothetical protein